MAAAALATDDTSAQSRPEAATGLIQLVYVSAAAPGLAPDQIERIRDSSERDNARLGITGLLLHQGASFYGVLEGDRRRVFRLMERIITDPRHRDVQILRESPVRRRRFENWSFGAIPRGVSGAHDRIVSDDFIHNLSRRLKSN